MGKGYIEDWATKAARRIVGEYDGRRLPHNSEERVAAIIATFAEPIIKLLGEAQEGRHYDGVGEIPGPECPKLEHEDAECTCGADEWNARVDKALRG